MKFFSTFALLTSLVAVTLAVAPLTDDVSAIAKQAEVVNTELAKKDKVSTTVWCMMCSCGDLG